jgi:hypothetical protein
MDYFLLALFFVFGVIAFLAVMVKLSENNTKEKQRKFISEYSELFSKFHKELLAFKDSSGFGETKSNYTFDSLSDTQVWYWVHNSILYGRELMGLIDDTDFSNEALTKFVLKKIRGFSDMDGYYQPLEYAEFEKFKGIEIPIDEIVYFSEKGEVFQNTSVSGGGSSLGGAIVGGVLAGGVGAVIGSRKKVESETVTTDNREVILVYYEGEKLTKKKFSYKTLEVFDQLIPGKNYEFIQMQNMQKK